MNGPRSISNQQSIDARLWLQCNRCRRIGRIALDGFHLLSIFQLSLNFVCLLTPLIPFVFILFCASSIKRYECADQQRNGEVVKY